METIKNSSWNIETGDYLTSKDHNQLIEKFINKNNKIIHTFKYSLVAVWMFIVLILFQLLIKI